MKKILASIVLFLCATSLALAQNVSSSVRANIVDITTASVVGAECLLTNQATGAVATVKSDGEGSCVFNIVLAGTYDFMVKATGFKTLESKGIVVTAGQVRTLGNLTLEVGALTEKVEVSGAVSQIQLATGEKSGTIDQSQLQNIAVKGRDLYAYMVTIPGIVDDGSQGRETTTPDSQRGSYINGGRQNQKNFTLDGVTAMDTGSNETLQFEPNMDAIAEIKVLTSNYQAEYGRNSLGTVSVITKGGQKDFHATAYDYYRHESLNANSWGNNKTNTAKSPYRYRITGYSIGGPVYIPKLFNKGRDKLFFFWDQEYTGMRKNYGTQLVHTPTQDERNGDFSHSVNSAGQLITIYDPLTQQPFSGNIVPKTRFSTLGSAMLNFFPLPNYTDPDPAQVYNRNYRSQYSGAYPKREDLFRIDYNITPSLQVYYRYIHDKDEQNTPYGMWVNGGINYSLTPTVFGQPGRGQVIHVTKSFSSTLVNEFIFGKSHNNLYFYPLDPSV
ncbi:MAG: carboxypeptidase regulatory-like domain-containing protein, partial [Acidobacteriia bacterium]|nr:carboxypeptidase regulatory-like domain-containing protein [Terriglobia bacterium]